MATGSEIFDAQYGFPGYSPEDAQAAALAASEQSRKLLNSYASMPLALAYRDPALSGVAGQIPLTGLAEALAGTGGAVLGAGSSLANAGLDSLGFKTRLPGAPEWMTAAGQHFENTRRGIQEDIGLHTALTAPDPNDPLDRMLDITGSTLGSAIPLVPAGLARAATSLAPYGLKTVTGALLPSTAHLGANTTIAGAVAGEQLAHEAFGPDAQGVTQTQDVGVLPQQPMQEAANRRSDTMTDIGLGSVIPTPPSGTNDIGLSSVLGGGAGPPIPSPDTGYSGMTVGNALWTIGGIVTAIAAARYTHGVGNVITDVERTARFNDPAYAAQAADYNNARIARGGLEISSGLDQPNPPPLPEQNRFRQATNWANNEFLNSNAQMQDAIRMSADPSVAESQAYMYGLTHNEVHFKVKLGAFLDTGLDPVTGIRIPSPIKLWRDISRLSKDEQTTLNDGLHASDEKNNRDNNMSEFQRQNPGVTPAPDDIRHNFKYQDDAALAAKIAQMRADPRLADIADRFFQIPAGLVDIGEGRGFFTSTEARNLKATHVNYVPEVNAAGETLHPMGRRDRTTFTGTDQVNSVAWHNMAQHLDELYRQFELNESNRSLRESQMDAQRQFPGSAQFMYDVPPPRQTAATYYSGGGVREPIVTIRTATGPVFTRVDHPDFLNAMTGDSLQKRSTIMGALAVPRRMYQYFTTGVGSLLSGRLGPIINTGYTALTSPINAPRGTYGGLLDRAVQRNLPEGVANVLSPVARGVDMFTTQPGAVGYAYGRGVYDRTAGRIGRMLEPGEDNYLNNWFRAHLSPTQVDAMSTSLQRYFEQTRTHRMVSELGLGGSGNPVKVDLPSLQILANKRASTMSAQMVPKLFMSDGMFGVAKPIAFSLNRAVQEAMGHLSDAGMESWTRLNWDNPNVSTPKLAYEARNIVGDPSVTPRNPYVKGLLGAVPYGNVALQGSTRFAKSLGDRPIGAPVTLATGLGTLALIELFTHMRSDAHMDYYQNAVSAQQQTGNLILATNDDPTKPTMIQMPQELRAAKAFASALIGNALNAIAVRHDPDTFKNVWDGLVDFLGSHITNKAVDSMIHGGVDVGDFINPPQWMGHVDWNGVIHGKGLVDSYRSPINSSVVNLPNQVQDGPLDDKNGKVWRGLLTSVFGLLGVAVDDVNNTIRYAKQTGSWVDALGMTGHDWLQGFKDKNPQFNMLWEHPVRLSMQPPIEEMMQRKLDAIDKVTGARTAERAEGMTSADRYAQPVPTSTTAKLPTDPTMKTLYNMVDAYKTRMAGRRTEINELKAQMGAVQLQGMDPDTRRKWMNDQTRNVADKYRLLYGMMSDMEYALSQQVGRPVHIETLDFNKGPEQFQ